MSTVANWTPSTGSVSNGDTFTFSGLGSIVNPVNNLGASFTIGALGITFTGGSYTISNIGTNAWSMSSGSTISNTTSNQQSIGVPLVINGTLSLQSASGGTLALAQKLSGGGGGNLNINSGTTGVVQIGGTNTFVSTTVNLLGGTLEISGTSPLGTIPTSSLRLASGTTLLTPNTGATVPIPASLIGASPSTWTINSNSGGTLTLSNGLSGGSSGSTLNINSGGNTGIVSFNAGTFNFIAGIELLSGTLEVGTNSALGTSNLLTMSDGTSLVSIRSLELPNIISLNTGANCSFQSLAGGMSLTQVMGDASVTILGSGGCIISNASYTRSTTINGGTLGIQNSISSSNVHFTGTGTLEFLNSGTLNYSGGITESMGISGRLSIQGVGIFLYSGTNQISGDTFIGSGTFKAGSTTAFSPNSRIELSTSGGILDLGGFSNTIEGLDGIAGTTITNSNGTATLTINSLSGYGGTIEDTSPGVLAITVPSGVTFGISGVSTYSGDTNVMGTMYAALSNTGFSPNSAHILSTSGTLDLMGASNTIASLTGAAGATIQSTTGAGVLTISGGTTTFAGDFIDGSGGMLSLTLQGGSLTLTGNSTHSGATNVNGGTLALNGTFSASPLTVGSGAILKGTGTAAAVTILNGGTLAPGNSPGTFTMTSLQLNTNSITQINIDNSGYSSLIINGNMPNDTVLAGELQVLLAPGTTISGCQSYLIVQGDTAIDTQFDSITNNNPAYSYTLSYPIISPYNVYLSICVLSNPATTLTTTNLSGNNLALANYLNSLSGNPLIQSLIESLDALPDLSSALSSISPSRNAALSYSCHNAMFLFTSYFANNLSSLRLTHLMTPASVAKIAEHKDLIALNEGSLTKFISQNNNSEERAAGEARTLSQKTEPYLIYVDGFYQWAHQKAQSSNPAFNMQTEGAMIGFDYYGLQNGEIGAIVGYARNNVFDKHDAGSGSVDIYTASLYGTAYVGNGYFDVACWGGYDRFKNTATSPILDSAAAKSSHQGAQVVPHFGLGYDIHYNPVVLEPFGNLDWAVLFQEGYSETGAGILDMSVKSSTSSMLRSEVGLNVYEMWDGAFGLIVLKESASYVNEVPFSAGSADAALVGFPGSFSTVSLTKLLNLFSAKFEILYKGPSGYYGSASYEGEFGSQYKSNQLVGEVGLFF